MVFGLFGRCLDNNDNLCPKKKKKNNKKKKKKNKTLSMTLRLSPQVKTSCTPSLIHLL